MDNDEKVAGMDRAGELPLERRTAERRAHPALVTILSERVAELEAELRDVRGQLAMRDGAA